MGYKAITQAANDQALTDRTTGCAAQEAHNNPALKGTDYAALVRQSPPSAVAPLQWAVANAGQAAYESALAAGNPDPGGDEAVITDATILAAVQTNWPQDT